MKCKKCGNNIELNYCSCLTKELIKYYKSRNKKIPSIIFDIYKGHSRIFCCDKCNELIDYKDMPVKIFFKWLQHSSDAGDTRKTSGKALIRYFELDKLLELRKR